MTEENKEIEEAESESQTSDDAEASVETEQSDAGGTSSNGSSAQEEQVAPVEVLHPKEARRKRRSVHSGEANPPRSLEERVAEREAAKAQKAKLRRQRRSKKSSSKGSSESKQPLVASVPESETAVVSRAKIMQGTVVSDKADKTITVRVEDVRRHRRYAKVIRRSNTVHAHDEHNSAHPGDTVRVVECRPLSRTKRWRLVEILEKTQ